KFHVTHLQLPSTHVCDSSQQVASIPPPQTRSGLQHCLSPAHTSVESQQSIPQARPLPQQKSKPVHTSVEVQQSPPQARLASQQNSSSLHTSVELQQSKSPQ
ncbi:24743_t:CDS:1, partial [Gigaspora rosea]